MPLEGAEYIKLCNPEGHRSVQAEGALKTHSLHADIIVNVSGSKHIAAALSSFGVTGSTKDLLVAKIDASGRLPTSWMIPPSYTSMYRPRRTLFHGFICSRP